MVYTPTTELRSKRLGNVTNLEEMFMDLPQ